MGRGELCADMENRSTISVQQKEKGNSKTGCGVPQWLKLSPTQEMQVRSLGQEDPLEEGTATHSSILAWRIPWTEESGGLQSMSYKELDMTEATEHAHMHKTECRV